MRLTRLAICLGVALLPACAPQRPAAPAAQTLRVAVPRDTPPYAFRRDGQLAGLEVDFARELAAALGRPVAFVETDFDDVIRALGDRRADIAMAGMSITRARQVLMSFSDPYLHSGLLTAMRTEDVPRFKHAADILRTNEPIGVVAGTTADRFVREKITTAPALGYPTARAAMDELRQRRVTFVVHDAPVVISFAAADEADIAPLIELLNHEDLGWGMRRDDDTLRTAVNGVLARWRTDGTRDRILARWVPYWQRLEQAETAR